MYTRPRNRIHKLLLRFIINVYLLARRMNLRWVLPALEKLASKVSLPKDSAGWETLGSTAIIAYEGSEYPNLYGEPLNGGVMPLNNSSWGSWTDAAGDTYSHNPLSASQDGLDGKTTPGHIDDYWFGDGYLTPEPYVKDDRQEHVADSLGDYMRTSQSTAGNADGDTKFYKNDSSRPKKPKKRQHK